MTNGQSTIVQRVRNCSNLLKNSGGGYRTAVITVAVTGKIDVREEVEE